MSHSLSFGGYHRNERCIKISADSNTKALHNLIQQLNNNDPLAFEEIYKRCSGHVAFVCQKFCGSKEDAEEVVQDTFLIAFKKTGMLKSDTFMGYLRKIAIHESLRKRKGNLRLQKYVVSMDDEQTENMPELDTDFLPEQHLQDKENRAELLQIIKSLPQMQWEMIYMYYYADFRTEEIASLYNCSTSNVRKTLRNARSTIKSKLEGTGKKTAVKGMALLPLAALFFMEEEVFAASYVPTAAPSIAVGVAGSSIKGYIIAASIVAVCAVSTVAYFALQPGLDDGVYQPYEPAYQAYTPALNVADVEDAPEELQPPEAAEEAPEQAEMPEEIPEAEPIQEPAPYVVTEPQQVEPPEPEPTPEMVEAPEEMEQQEEVETEIPETEPEEEPPPPIDRTPEILIALAAANAAAEVNRIIGYYGFMFDRQMRTSTDELLRFYVTNEGSGDILIGTAAYEDNSQWRMSFEYFDNGTMPSDILQLFRFMAQ